MNETVETALYLLHRKAKAPSQAYPNVVSAKVSQISRAIRSDDTHLAELIRKRNYYTHKVYQYLNELGQDEPERKRRLEKERHGEKREKRDMRERRDMRESDKENITGRTQTKESDKDKITGRTEDVKEQPSQSTEHGSSVAQILADTNKEKEIGSYVQDQRARQFQWQTERESLVATQQTEIEQYRVQMLLQMEKYHPSKLASKREEMQSRMSEMEQSAQQQLDEFDERVYRECEEIAKRTLGRLEGLGVRVSEDVLVEISEWYESGG